MDQKLWKQRWRRAVWVAWFLRFLPFVRMVGLNGSMVTGKLRPASDLDFFVVIKDDHIFTGRVLVTLCVQLLGVRLHDQRTAGRVCLNRYASSSFLRITPYNRYHAEVFHNLIPLFSVGSTYERFCQENQWMGRFDFPIVVHVPVWQPSAVSRAIQWLGEQLLLPFTIWLETAFRKEYEGRVGRDRRSQWPGSQIIISAQEIRFHLPKSLSEYAEETTSFSLLRH